MLKLKKKKRKSLRDSTQYKNINPKVNLKGREEELTDVFSYFMTLNAKDKKWLEKFVKEWIIASPQKNKKDRLIKNIKDIWDRNNQRNRCAFSRKKIQGLLDYISDKVEVDYIHVDSMLDNMIREEDRLETEKKIVDKLVNPFGKIKTRMNRL